MSQKQKVAGVLDSHSPTGDGCSSSQARREQREQDASHKVAGASSSKVQPGQRDQDAPATLVPELRFPEFRGNGEWQERPLGYFLNEHKKKSDGQSEVHSVSVHKGVINQKEHLGRSFAAKDTSNYNLAHPHDVIYTKSPTGDFAYGVVKQNRLQFNAIVSPLYGVFTPVTAAAGYIIHCFFESPQRAYKYLDPITQKGAKNTIQITNQGFLSGMVLFPHSKAEQQKIADCLGSLDDLIAAHSRKLAALQDHKKGLLQQLFPAEGETTPKLRFTEFEGEWTKASLGDISTTTIGEFVIKTKQDPEAPYPVYNGGRSHTGFYELYNNEGNQIVISARGAAGHVNLVKRKFWAGNSCYSVSLVGSENNLDFVYWYIKHNQSRFTENQHAANIPSVNKGDVEQFTVFLATPPEQQKIADCLSALEALITAETEQIAALKAHKKGLMQQLFPNPNTQPIST